MSGLGESAFNAHDVTAEIPMEIAVVRRKAPTPPAAMRLGAIANAIA